VKQSSTPVQVPFVQCASKVAIASASARFQHESKPGGSAHLLELKANADTTLERTIRSAKRRKRMLFSIVKIFGNVRTCKVSLLYLGAQVMQ
jgi:hypothetical protein